MPGHAARPNALRSPFRALSRVVTAGVLALLAAPLLLAGTARAQSADLRPNAAGVRVGKDGLGFIKDQLPGLLPNHIDLPPIDKDLKDCPAGRSIIAHVTDASADLHLNSLDAGLSDGSVDVDVNLDVRGRGHIRVENAYACFGELSCDVTFGLNAAGLKAKLGVAAAQGNVSVSLKDVLLSLTPDDLDYAVSGCSLDGLIEGFADLAKGLLFDYLKGKVTDLLEQKVPPLVQDTLQGLIGRQGTLLGFDYTLQLGDVSVTTDGIDAYLSLGIDYSGPDAGCLPPGAQGTQAASLGDLSMGKGPGSAFVLAISSAFVSDALLALWRSGLLCIDDGKLEALGLDLSQFDLAHVVPGVPPGTELHFNLVTAQPPAVAGTDGGAVQLSLAGAELHLNVTAPGSPPAEIVIGTDVTLSAKADADPTTGMIGLSIVDLKVDRLEIQSGQDQATQLSIDPGKIEQLVQEIVLPLIASKVGTVPLGPSSFGVLGYYVTVEGIVAAPEGLYVGIGVFKAPASDDTKPETRIVSSPNALTRPGLVKFVVSGTDDQTPSSLLRFSWSLDDGPATTPSFAREIRVPVTTDGQHVFRVVAIDLNDNVAADTQSFLFELDSIAPTLQMTPPPAIVDSPSIKVSVKGSDDRTPSDQLLFSYRLEEAKPGERAQVIKNTDPAPLSGDIALDNLTDGNVYTLTVLVQDAAGNITSQSAGFSVSGASSGCAMTRRAGGGRAQGLVGVFGLLGLLGLIGRAARTRRFAFARRG